jgi:alpha-beta hydrolase superfamily lysophospholipase
MAWPERDVVAPAEPAPLHGTLALPDDGTARAGILLIAGSGPVDRNGNAPGVRNDGLKLLAHGLAARGIATLRADKRGVGDSRAAMRSEQTLRFDTYVEDAVGWLAVLRTHCPTGRVFVLGHSEGALVGTMAAQRAPVAGVILIAGLGTPAGAVIERQLAEAGVPSSLRDTAHRIIAALERGERLDDVPAELSALFRPSVQSYLISWLRLNPAIELTKVPAPVLLLQGTNDLQVSVADARALAASRRDATLTLIEGMNHVLKTAPPERTANLATYADPTIPLAADLLPAIIGFVAP